jgi:hypothetical protein
MKSAILGKFNEIKRLLKSAISGWKPNELPRSRAARYLEYRIQ